MHAMGTGKPRIAGWKSTARQMRTLADGFAELRELCRDEDYELVLPERRDRPNVFGPEPFKG